MIAYRSTSTVFKAHQAPIKRGVGVSNCSNIDKTGGTQAPGKSKNPDRCGCAFQIKKRLSNNYHYVKYAFKTLVCNVLRMMQPYHEPNFREKCHFGGGNQPFLPHPAENMIRPSGEHDTRTAALYQ